jgi:DNA-binding transcriptional LysR family regulator
MEIYQLENFIAVVEEHSFTRAADRVFRTQAAVSVAIRKLEEEMGVPLVARESRECALTEAGHVMLGYALKMIGLRNEAQRALAEFTCLAAGQVSIAAHESAAQYLLPGPLAAFHLKYPTIKITTRLCAVDEIARLVAEREVDLGFGIRQEHLRGLHSEVIHSDPMVLVAAAGHRLNDRGILQMDDLGDEPFFTHHLRTSTVDHVEQIFSDRSVRFNVVAELWNFETVKHFVASGAGLAIVPLSVARQDIEAGRLIILPVPALDMARNIELIYRDRMQLLPAPTELLSILRGWKWDNGLVGNVPFSRLGTTTTSQPSTHGERIFRSRLSGDSRVPKLSRRE